MSRPNRVALREADWYTYQRMMQYRTDRMIGMVGLERAILTYQHLFPHEVLSGLNFVLTRSEHYLHVSEDKLKPKLREQLEKERKRLHKLGRELESRSAMLQKESDRVWNEAEAITSLLDRVPKEVKKLPKAGDTKEATGSGEPKSPSIPKAKPSRPSGSGRIDLEYAKSLWGLVDPEHNKPAHAVAMILGDGKLAGPVGSHGKRLKWPDPGFRVHELSEPWAFCPECHLATSVRPCPWCSNQEGLGGLPPR